MKAFIMGVALLLIFSTFLVYDVDAGKHAEYLVAVKAAASDGADGAALFYDTERYATGSKVFNYTEGNKAASYIIKTALGLKSDLSFSSDLVSGQCSYEIYYIDDSGYCWIFQNGQTLTAKKEISFPYQFTDKESGFTIMVREPTVIVAIDAGQYLFQSSMIGEVKVRRVSGYENWRY